MCTSHHSADAAVLGFGAAGCLGGGWRRPMVVGTDSRVGGVRWVPMLRMSLVGWLLAVRWGQVVLVWRVLQVGRWVVVVVMVVRRGVLGHMAELGVMNGDWCVCLHSGCVMQVGGMRGVGDEGGVHGLWCGAR